MYFYDLENNRTCAKVSNGELLLDSYPHQSDEGITLIRYIMEETLFERSVNFSLIKSNGSSLEQEIYQIDSDDSNLTNQSKEIVQ